MPKTYFHNSKLPNENKEIVQTLNKDIKTTVDINILLNRVKSEEKNQAKRKIIFFSFTTVAVSLFGTFIAIIK